MKGIKYVDFQKNFSYKVAYFYFIPVLLFFNQVTLGKSEYLSVPYSVYQ